MLALRRPLVSRTAAEFPVCTAAAIYRTSRILAPASPVRTRARRAIESNSFNADEPNGPSFSIEKGLKSRLLSLKVVCFFCGGNTSTGTNRSRPQTVRSSCVYDGSVLSHRKSVFESEYCGPIRSSAIFRVLN